MPYTPKPILPNRLSTADIQSEKIIDEVFQYLALPTTSLFNMLIGQDFVTKNITQLRCENVLVLSGKNDLTVDIQTLLSQINYQNANLKFQSFENSAHNVFLDNDKDEAIKVAVEFLKQFE